MDESLYSAFAEIVKQYPDHEAVAELQGGIFSAITYQSLHERVQQFAHGLRSNCAVGERIAVMLDNGSWWPTVDFAASYIGAVVVPVHTTYTAHYLDLVLRHAEPSVFVTQKKYFEKFADKLGSFHFKQIIIVDGMPLDTKGLSVMTADEVITAGSADSEPHLGTADDVHTIVYTSGTTGVPKGVMLTHRNLISNVAGAKAFIPITPDDRFFSFMPVAHILERTAGQFTPLLSGAAVYYARGRDTLVEDMQAAQPTVVVSVPRIFEKAHEKIIERFTNHALTHGLLKQAQKIARKSQRGIMNALDKVQFALFDKIIFAKIRAIFGGRLRFAVSGGASLGKHVAVFFEELGIIIVEGYGLTETSPIVTLNTLQQRKPGTVGLPMHGVDVKLDQTGEILVRGSGLMKGYYQAPDITAERIDSEGYLHTGDLGSFDTDGFLTIVGRRSEMIVLSTGRNIFPVPIEQAIEESKYIAQAMVCGDNQKAIAALIVPEFEVLEAWCKEQGISYRLPEVLGEQRVLDLFKGEITKMVSHLQHFEQARDFKLVAEEWTQENEMLTPSLKLKRGIIMSKSTFK